ncbi:hypothetical protein SAMN05444002_0818 [Vannielia litorea]|uniref:Uncharacterized protein n=1 Tax=Vannielia litorea TaxID=1217970 RepID=A0A1N6EID2_9RHOB|nr:hypothetical protein SAMN05444002_0818 [Vannielia litorea]
MCLLGHAVPAETDCTKWPEFTAPEPYLKPQSVSMNQIQNYLNASESSEGVIFDVERKGRELWLDIVYVPADATVIVGVRSIFQIGRLIDGDFDSIVFSDDGQGLYALPEPMLRELGCQFIWGREGGQNPIYLIRVFFQNLRDFENGKLAVSGFNGSLLGDTGRAMSYHNEVFAPKWILTALE